MTAKHAAGTAARAGSASGARHCRPRRGAPADPAATLSFSAGDAAADSRSAKQRRKRRGKRRGKRRCKEHPRPTPPAHPAIPPSSWPVPRPPLPPAGAASSCRRCHVTFPAVAPRPPPLGPPVPRTRPTCASREEAALAARVLPAARHPPPPLEPTAEGGPGHDREHRSRSQVTAEPSVLAAAAAGPGRDRGP